MTSVYIGADNSIVLDELTDSTTGLFANSATVTFTLYRLLARDGATTAASTTLSSAAAPFVSGDASRSIIVLGADTNGGDLRTTISTYTSTSAVVLAGAAAATLTNCEVRISVTDATAVSMAYVTASDGKYRGTLDEGVKLANGQQYWIEVSADAGSDVKDFRVLEVTAEYRQ